MENLRELCNMTTTNDPYDSISSDASNSLTSTSAKQVEFSRPPVVTEHGISENLAGISNANLT
jgi:hypothetical protein